MDHHTSRRDLLLTSLMAAQPLGIGGAAASPLNPEQTIIKPPETLQWQTLPPFPPGSVDNVALAGQTTAPGLYYTLVRWHPGYMRVHEGFWPADPRVIPRNGPAA